VSSGLCLGYYAEAIGNTISDITWIDCDGEPRVQQITLFNSPYHFCSITTPGYNPYYATVTNEYALCNLIGGGGSGGGGIGDQ
jgi:hypothetical protein